MTFRHGKDVPFPKMVQIRSALKGLDPEHVEGVIKRYLKAEKETRRAVKRANERLRRRKAK